MAPGLLASELHVILWLPVRKLKRGVETTEAFFQGLMLVVLDELLVVAFCK